MERHLFLSLFVAVLAFAQPAEAIRISFSRSLVGRWVSPRDTLTFFASHEFTFGDEHGPAGRWSLDGQRLRFGIPKRGVDRHAQILGVTPHRLTLRESGQVLTYDRLEHY
jgi:hypothetical protein